MDFVNCIQALYISTIILVTYAVVDQPAQGSETEVDSPRKHRHKHGHSRARGDGGRHERVDLMAGENVVVEVLDQESVWGNASNPEPPSTVTLAPEVLFFQQSPGAEYWHDGPQLYARPPGAAGCMYNEYYYHPMQLFMLGDGCNTCVCDNYNHMICTLLDCAHNSGCSYHGESYDIFEHWPLGIGCQVCACHEDGYIACDLDEC